MYTEQEIAGCFVLDRKQNVDDRGFTQELYSQRNPIKETDHWKQVNLCTSNKDVVRGINLAPYGKLATCIAGKVFFVVVDLRPNSSTFKKWLSWWLTAETQVYVPPMCGSGLYSAENNSVVLYLQEAIWHPNIEECINWQDTSIDIRWPKADKYILSDKDRSSKTYDIILSRPNHKERVRRRVSKKVDE